VTASGFDAEGIRVISPADDSFGPWVDDLAEPMWAPFIKDAVPSVVVLVNESDRTIVAMSTVFEVNGGVRASRNSVFFVAPDAIASSELDYGRASEEGIAPGEGRMIGFNFRVPDRTDAGKFTQEERDFYDPQTRNWIKSTAADLVTARAVHVSLDTVIFADGLLLGDDASRLASHFDALVQEKQRVYRFLVNRLDAGEPAGAVIEAFMRQSEPELDRLDSESYAANEARNTVYHLLRNYGPEALRDVVSRALLPQPFVIVRRS
jgi:hypothetical protein